MLSLLPRCIPSKILQNSCSKVSKHSALMRKFLPFSSKIFHRKCQPCFCFSSWWFYTYCQCNRSTLDMVQSVVLVPVFISIKNTLDFDGCNTIRSTKINLNNLLWKFIDVFKEPLFRRYLPLALDIHPKTPAIH